MHLLSELIAAFLAMDDAGQAAFLAAAKEYADTRKSKRPSARLHLLPGALRMQTAPDGVADGNEQVAFGVTRTAVSS